MSDDQEKSAGSPAQMNDVVARLGESFSGALLSSYDFRDETTLVIAPDKLIDACRFLRDDPALKFAMLADLTAVDWLPTDREPRFQVVYHLLSLEHNRRLRLKIDVAEDDATAPSVTDIWPTANFFEREVYDLFGIRFAGHPDLRRILMPDDWLTYPLRKDVPLGEEDVDFSHNQQPAEP